MVTIKIPNLGCALAVPRGLNLLTFVVRQLEKLALCIPCSIGFFVGVLFCGLVIFCVLREQFFAVRDVLKFLLGTNFCDFLVLAAKH